MSEKPHCPNCKLYETVRVSQTSGYTYYCRNCDLEINPSDITDAAFIHMCSRSMFRDYEKALQRATFDFNSECDCSWCQLPKEDKQEVINDVESMRS